MRRTKIVCTIGPASESVETLATLMEKGMNVARLNFSHGSYEEHAARIANIRQAASTIGKTVAILLDIKGPKIRTGMIQNDAVELKTGDTITLTTEEVLGTADRVSISYAGLPEDVRPGSRLLIDDGLIGLVVEKVQGSDIVCKITNGGLLKNRKGINAPGVVLRIPSVTEKDINDIKFGIQQGVDMIAASFVRKATDILDVRRVLEAGEAKMDIIAKIEAEEALDKLDEILEVADGMMVARGDLGVEIATEEVPLWQKVIIEKCNQAGKVVITATQMLDSMERNPRPTRAEASDVANAIFDGTDAIMLSGETAAGKYPILAVETMARIAERAEEALYENIVPAKQRNWETISVTDSISHAAVTIAHGLKAKAIVTPTESGNTPRRVSKYRPDSVIIAATPDERVARRLCLVNGVYPMVVNHCSTTDEMFEVAIEGALSTGLVKNGDMVVITAGVPVGESGTTNLLKVHTISDVVGRGQGMGQQVVTGRVFLGDGKQSLASQVQKGDILVVSATDADMVPAIEKVSAVITEEGGLTSHAAVVCLSMGVPVIVGVEKATTLLEQGQVVTIDGSSGLIYKGRAQVL